MNMLYYNNSSNSNILLRNIHTLRGTKRGINSLKQRNVGFYLHVNSIRIIRNQYNYYMIYNNICGRISHNSSND